jgi:SagB-type dehydrogenase family enzyme
LALGPAGGGGAGEVGGAYTTLPAPRKDGDRALERALDLRRSVREFSEEPLRLADVSQILWAAQGLGAARGRRTVPSAGALYPIEIYLVAGSVRGIAAGTYHYQPARHRLRETSKGDARREVARVALDQEWVADAPAILVLAAVYERTTRKYGGRARRYVHMEAGHAAQNVYLQAAALDLGTCLVGAFRDAQLKRLLDLPDATEVLGLMPVGNPG